MGHRKVTGFYEPHDAVNFDGLVTCPFTGEVTRPPSMTKQEFVAECDINNIMKEYSLSGQIAHINSKAALGAFMDLPGGLDFQEAISVVQQASAAFALLPSQVRDRFANNPEGFLAFCEDPRNSAELVTWGLAKAPAAESPASTTISPNPDPSVSSKAPS